MSVETLHPRPGCAETSGAGELRASLLPPLPNHLVLPQHHPLRDPGDKSLSYPYAKWSAGILAQVDSKAPSVIPLRGHHLRVRVDVARGGRILSISDASGHSYESEPEVVVDGLDARGAGLFGGIEVNSSDMFRSPWALERVYAAVGLPSRLGGDRLRWWEFERQSGHLLQVDVHLPDDVPVVLLVMKQRLMSGSGSVPVSISIDHPRAPGPGTQGFAGSTVRVVGPASAQQVSRGVRCFAVVEEDDPEVSWVAIALEEVDAVRLHSLVDRAVCALDDRVGSSCGHLLLPGSGWPAVEALRAGFEGSHEVDWPQTPVRTDFVDNEVSHRHRPVPAAQWLHLLQDQGLGVVDRVNQDDVGEAGGRHWRRLLERSFRREAQGDWRVHLRLGDLDYLEGNLNRARERWSWSYSLRPSVFADRNLALLEMRQGRWDSAAVRYLRAQRGRPGDPELATEAVGCLIHAGRAKDAGWVLDRLKSEEVERTATYWLLHGEVAAALSDRGGLDSSLFRAYQCPDAKIHRAWLTSLSLTL